MREIDIVAEKNKERYFFELKYRRDALHGTGWEYVALRKLGRMQFVAGNKLRDHEGLVGYRLAAVGVTSNDSKLTNFIDAFY